MLHHCIACMLSLYSVTWCEEHCRASARMELHDRTGKAVLVSIVRHCKVSFVGEHDQPSALQSLQRRLPKAMMAISR